MFSIAEIRSIKFLRNYYVVSCVLLLLVSGCQPKVYLMPPPIGIDPGGNLFDLSENDRDGNLLHTLYATNRVPIKRMSGLEGYTINPSDSIRLGFVVHSVGDENMSWEELYRQSTTNERNENLLLKQVYVREIVEYVKKEDVGGLPARADGYFNQLNESLAKKFDRDIFIYVHGANCNFYRATAQGAQTFHFTGHNIILLTFSWPSAENIFKYKTDVLHARSTVPAFGRLIEILADHTDADRINILAYSAGAQVVAPGLEYLRDKYPAMSTETLKEKLRIGEVYFAAPDIDFDSFAQRFGKFKDIVDRTTINLNTQDKVLRLSAFQNGVSRLGRPDRQDITSEDQQILINASRTSKLDILDVAGSKGLKMGGSHDFWYSHPWVSNDLLLLSAFSKSPTERGLKRHILENGLEINYFPINYEQVAKEIIRALKDELQEDIEKWQRDAK